MKIKAVYFSNKKVLDINLELLIVSIVFLLAIITGTTVVFLSDECTDIKNYFLQHISSSMDNSYFKIFFTFISGHLILLFLSFVSGTSLYGKIPILCLYFFKIAGISSIIAFLIKTYMLKGLEYCLLVFFPGKILLIFTVIFISVNCMKTSDLMNKINKKIESAEFSGKLYLKQFMLSGILLFASALTDTLLLKLFLPLFDFI